jgi:hypothetical protein
LSIPEFDESLAFLGEPRFYKVLYMKILMICKGEYYEFMPVIAGAIKRQHGHSLSAMTFATPTADLNKMRVFDEIHNLAGYLKQQVPGYDIDECIQYLRELELSDELANLNVMIYADRIIRQYPFERVLKILAGVCRFWDKLFREVRPDAVLGEVACASEWIAWSFARRSNIQYLIPYPGPLPKRFNFVRSPAGGWDSTESLIGATDPAGGRVCLHFSSQATPVRYSRTSVPLADEV